jgi:putative transcriptional regulator
LTIAHHPDAATLLGYAAGSLGEALGTVVAAHLAWCPACRREVRTGEALGGALLDSIAETPLAGGALDRALARLDRAPAAAALRCEGASALDPALPLPLAHRLGRPLEAVKWRRLAPGVGAFELPTLSGARGHLHLLKVASGRAIPEHGHGGQELTLILQGSYSDTIGRFARGDVADLDPEIEHKPVADFGDDCICLVATEAPTRFKSRLSRLLQPFFRI